MPLRLMCLTAHPDDEAGAFGGALLMAAARGAQTAVLCMTAGDAGSYREPGQSDEDLAALRRSEFADCCEALAVSESELLHYSDGKLWEEPFLPLVGVLVRGLRRFRPHVVLTFGGEGGVNLHRDHTAISLAATAAFHWAGRSGFFPEHNLPVWASQKLYYASTPFVTSADEEAVRNSTRVPPSLALRLNDTLKHRKRAAFQKHSSQQGVLERVEAQFGDVLAEEAYLLAAARRPFAGERDIWDGVEAD